MTSTTKALPVAMPKPRDMMTVWLEVNGDTEKLGVWFDMTMLALHAGSRYVRISYKTMSNRYGIHYEKCRRIAAWGTEQGIWRVVNAMEPTTTSIYEILMSPWATLDEVTPSAPVTSQRGEDGKIVAHVQSIPITMPGSPLPTGSTVKAEGAVFEPQPLPPKELLPRQPSGPDYSEVFLKAWERYPKRVGHSKKAAWKMWKRAMRHGVQEDYLIVRVEAFRAYQAAKGNMNAAREMYIPHMSTWLNPETAQYDADYGSSDTTLTDGDLDVLQKLLNENA